ncbi:hypothetical protein CRUP_038464 [Coryphaenoides rupestris]|nr:hypothetical protein CRUP_038464 [Coryphaenoides rupestris]
MFLLLHNGLVMAYLRRSVLINNLLRRIHHQEEEEEEEEELGEEEEEEQEEEEEEVVERRRGGPYPDRKRAKRLLSDRCPRRPPRPPRPPRYHLMRACYPACTCLCRLDARAGGGGEHGARQYLLYKMDDNG